MFCYIWFSKSKKRVALTVYSCDLTKVKGKYKTHKSWIKNPKMQRVPQTEEHWLSNRNTNATQGLNHIQYQTNITFQNRTKPWWTKDKQTLNFPYFRMNKLRWSQSLNTPVSSSPLTSCWLQFECVNRTFWKCRARWWSRRRQPIFHNTPSELWSLTGAILLTTRRFVTRMFLLHAGKDAFRRENKAVSSQESGNVSSAVVSVIACAPAPPNVFHSRVSLSWSTL